MKVRTSNMGRLLNSRLLDDDDPQVVERREALIRTLFSPEMLDKSGIRTVSNKEIRFRPGAIHDGTVWLWDTYYVAQGLERQGYYGLATQLENRNMMVMVETKRFPEFVRRDNSTTLNDRNIMIWDETNQFKNKVQQPPEEMQTWTVAAILASKIKRDPLHPENRGPTQTTDPNKNTIEQEILGNLEG